MFALISASGVGGGGGGASFFSSFSPTFFSSLDFESVGFISTSGMVDGSWQKVTRPTRVLFGPRENFWIFASHLDLKIQSLLRLSCLSYDEYGAQ